MLSINIQTKDPTTLSLIVLLSSFALFYILLYILQPSFVQVIDKSGNKYRSKNLIASFSSTFAFLAAIVSLLVASERYRTPEDFNTQNLTRFSNANTSFSL